MLNQGNKIAHRYRMETILGQGGMGTVYLCHDEQLDRRVAVKCLRADIQNKVYKNKLIKEAKILAKLNHENIVQLYDIIEHEGQLALVMEYVHGTTLSHQLAAADISHEQGLYFLKQLCLGISIAHENGIIHKDLKADNVLITQEGRIKITDFGIAKVVDDINTHESGLMGSYASLSPEQAKGEKLDYRTDIFSLGVLSYQLFCNKHPFGNSKNPVAFFDQLLKKTPKQLNEHDHEIPLTLSQLTADMLEKNKEDRPQSLTYVFDTLNQVEVSGSVQRDLTSEHNTLELAAHSGHIEKPEIATGKSTLLVPKRRKSIKYFIFSIACIFIALAIGVQVTRHIQKQPNVERVGILSPTLNFEKSMETAEYQSYLVVKDAMENAILESKALALIPSNEFKNLSENPSSIGKSVSADTLLQLEMNCDTIRCSLKISKIDGSIGTIEKIKQWPILKHDIFNTYNSTQINLSEILQKNTENIKITSQISEPDYLKYIKIAEKFSSENEQAIDDLADSLTDLINKNPKYRPLYHLYRNVLIQAHYKTDEKQYLTQLKEVLLQADRLFQTDKKNHLNWFEFYLSSKDYSAANTQLELLSTKQYPNEELIKLQARLEAKKGSYTKAIALYERSARLQPNVKTYSSLAQLQWLTGDNLNSQNTLKKLFELSPNDYTGHSISAAISLTEGDFNSAINAYGILIEKHNSNRLYSDLGIAYLLAGAFTDAKIQFEKALEMSPNSSTLLLNIADTESLIGNKERALQLYNKVVHLTQENALTLERQLNLAQALAHTGQSLQAISTMQELLTKSSANPNVLFTASLVYTALKEYQSALVYFEQALDAGLGKVWFTLPWFDKLCQFPLFVEKSDLGKNIDRCH